MTLTTYTAFNIHPIDPMSNLGFDHHFKLSVAKNLMKRRNIGEDDGLEEPSSKSPGCSLVSFDQQAYTYAYPKADAEAYANSNPYSCIEPCEFSIFTFPILSMGVKVAIYFIFWFVI